MRIDLGGRIVPDRRRTVVSAAVDLDTASRWLARAGLRARRLGDRLVVDVVPLVAGIPPRRTGFSAALDPAAP
ncbi:MAG TPA: hypothetical protein VJS92_06520, partial [Candidatus Polarisedimenticolaceae bacterium]|nr:hypothetical protein [Candidatus Polarisedimenticolaceae bacterium]